MKCNKCGKRFPDRGRLNQHCRDAHGVTLPKSHRAPSWPHRARQTSAPAHQTLARPAAQHRAPSGPHRAPSGPHRALSGPHRARQTSARPAAQHRAQPNKNQCPICGHQSRNSFTFAIHMASKCRDAKRKIEEANRENAIRRAQQGLFQ